MKYKQNKGLIIQKLDKELVIFDGNKSILYTFNETASLMFSKIKLGWEKKKIIEFVTKKYETKDEKVEKDFVNLISDLKRKKILT